MIRFIKGIFHPQIDGTAIIETPSGIGFLVNIPANSPLYRNFEGAEVKVHTLMIVREDDMSLYGFDSIDELELFQLLITVNGVGPKAGMAIMSILPLTELKRAIAMGDVKAISAAIGVGKKTAERVILELKDRVDADISGEPGMETDFGFSPASAGSRGEAIDALVSLGYSKNEAQGVVNKIKDNDLSAEDYIRMALSNMM